MNSMLCCERCIITRSHRSEGYHCNLLLTVFYTPTFRHVNVSTHFGLRCCAFRVHSHVVTKTCICTNIVFSF